MRLRTLMKKPGEPVAEKTYKKLKKEDQENLMRLRTLREKRKTWRISREENPGNLEYLRQPGLVGDIEKVHPSPVRPVYAHNLNIQTSEGDRKKEEAGREKLKSVEKM